MTQPLSHELPDELQAEPRSYEWIVAVVLGYGALAVIPLIVSLTVIAAKFRGLTEFTALDHAQLARHLVAGDGWVTSVIRPLSLGFKPTLDHHPDLYNSPLHPWLLALFFNGFGASDRAAAWCGAATWAASLWLTFVVARHWLGARRAWFPVLLYAVHTPALVTSVNGLPYSLSACMVLLALWNAVPAPSLWGPVDAPHEEAEEAEEAEAAPALEPVLPIHRLLLTGLFCGLATLSHYLLAVFAIVLGIFVSRREPDRGQAAGSFLAGYLVAVVPWMLVLFLQTGSPIPTLYWYDLLVNSGSYPGDMVWRLVESPGHPIVHVATHPLQTVFKLFAGLGRYWREAPVALGPLACAVFSWVALQGVGGRLWTRSLGAVLVGVLTLATISCLFRPDPALLLAFSPFMAIVGAYGVLMWLEDRVGPIWRGERVIETRFLHGAALAGLAVVAAVPLLAYILTDRPQALQFAEQLQPVATRVPAGRAVLTDQPALVAWFANRTSVYLPQTEDGFAALEKTSGQVSASFVTPAIYQLPILEQSTWWSWLVLPQGVYRGLVISEPRLQTAVLRLRKEKN
ncbi:MAG: glycosyltransferase family 39 protein [Armatimonadetes bacterium]|nr:glycosyltransferase family 39 protein [Armatimonadota bacterium]